MQPNAKIPPERAHFLRSAHSFHSSRAPSPVTPLQAASLLSPHCCFLFSSRKKSRGQKDFRHFCFLFQISRFSRPCLLPWVAWNPRGPQTHRMIKIQKTGWKDGSLRAGKRAERPPHLCTQPGDGLQGAGVGHNGRNRL